MLDLVLTTNEFLNFSDFEEIRFSSLLGSKGWKNYFVICTGKYFSATLILASINPQYDKKLQAQNMLRTCCVQKLCFVFILTFRTIYVDNMFSTCSELAILMNNFLSYCGFHNNESLFLEMVSKTEIFFQPLEMSIGVLVRPCLESL